MTVGMRIGNHWKPFLLLSPCCRRFGYGDYEARELIEERVGRKLWLAAAGSIPGSDEMRYVRVFKTAETSDWFHALRFEPVNEEQFEVFHEVDALRLS
jgi:hypothetical protein